MISSSLSKTCNMKMTTEYRTNHSKQSLGLSSGYIVSDQPKTLMSINNLHDGHGTKQEKHDLTYFCRSMCQLRNSYISRRCLLKKVIAKYYSVIDNTWNLWLFSWNIKRDPFLHDSYGGRLWTYTGRVKFICLHTYKHW